MIWIKDYLPLAGMIRMPVGGVYHYAVYISDDEIIQFGEPPRLDKKIPDNDVRVCVTTLSRLLRDAEYIEGAMLDTDELPSRLPEEETIKRARSLVGKGGYSFLFNNCEHFAYNCVFGKPFSSQTEELRRRFLDIPVADVYIARQPENIDISPIYPKARYDEICNVSNDSVKTEKYYAWKLLRLAIERSLGYDFESLNFNKADNGKWICDRCEFSISHSSGFVAVAVSKKPIGVDIEKIEALNNENLPKRVLSIEEYNYFSSLPQDKANEYFIKMWTQKEAFYKYSSEKTFAPKDIIIPDNLLYSIKLEYGAIHYYLSVVSEDIKAVRIFKDIKL